MSFPTSTEKSKPASADKPQASTRLEDAQKSITKWSCARTDYCILALTLGWTLWMSLGSARLWDRDEPRNARCAVEMMQRNDWIVPMFNDELRTHKPILLYWLQIASYALFGQNEFAARFGSALCASIAVLAIYWLGKTYVSRSFGVWSAVSLGSSAMFVVAGRAATPDAVLIACSTLGVVLLASQLLESLAETATSRRFALGYAGYFFLGAAVLAKGPVGLIIPLTVIMTWGFLQLAQNSAITAPLHFRVEKSSLFATLYRWSANPGAVWQWLKGQVHILLKIVLMTIKHVRLVQGLAIVLAVSLPWYVWVGIRTDGQWLYGFFVEHNLNRAVSAMEGHSGGIWYYPLALLGGIFPWSLMLIPIVWWNWKCVRHHQTSPLVQLGVVWCFVTIAAFSCASTKLPSYITTCYPGVSLLVGGFFFAWQQNQFELSLWLRRLAGYVTGVAGIAVLIAVVVSSRILSFPSLATHAMWALALLLPAAMLLLKYSVIQGAVGFLQNRDSIKRSDLIRSFLQRISTLNAQSSPLGARASIAFAIAAVIVIGGTVGQGARVLSDYRNDLDVLVAAAQADRIATEDAQLKWMSVGTIEPSWVFYLQQPIKEVPNVGTAVDGSSLDWRVAAAAHLRQPNARLIMNENDVEALQSLDQYRTEYNAGVRNGPSDRLNIVPILRMKKFLKQDALVVVKAVAEKQFSRLAEEPRSPARR